jgi:predicted O-methyltransferase YrrM
MRRAHRRLRARLAARRLRSSDDPVIAAVGEALSYRPSGEERAWAARIESERERLSRSEEVLRTALYDYSLDPSHDHVFADRVASLATRSSKPPDAALFLFALVRRSRPDRVLELGTNLGISAAYLGAALRLNGGGSLVTIDASKERMRVARDVLAGLGLEGVVETRLGRFQAVLPEVLHEP